MKGSSEKNGRLPVLVNYIWPLIISTAVMMISYFIQRKDFGITRVQ